MIVELHTRLIDSISVETTDGGQSGLWKRRIEKQVAGEPLSYLSPTDLLLHLVSHAVYTHRFDNGPLTLSDLYYLIRGAQIDWPLFWRLADHEGWTRGCLLLLTTMRRYFGDVPIDFQDSASSDLDGADALATACSSLMLRDLASRSDTLLAGTLAGRPIRQKLSILLGKIFPPRARIEAHYPASVDSLGIYFGYLTHSAIMISKRVPEFLASRRRVAFGADARKMAELDRWLIPS